MRTCPTAPSQLPFLYMKTFSLLIRESITLFHGDNAWEKDEKTSSLFLRENCLIWIMANKLWMCFTAVGHGKGDGWDGI